MLTDHGQTSRQSAETASMVRGLPLDNTLSSLALWIASTPASSRRFLLPPGRAIPVCASACLQQARPVDHRILMQSVLLLATSRLFNLRSTIQAHAISESACSVMTTRSSTTMQAPAAHRRMQRLPVPMLFCALRALPSAMSPALLSLASRVSAPGST